MPTTCQEFRDGNIDTGDDVVVDCSGDLSTPSPITLGSSFNMSIKSSGTIDLPDLTTAGGFINIESSAGGDIILENVDSGAELTIKSAGKVTLNGEIKAKGFINIEAMDGEIIVNETVIYDGSDGENDIIEIKTENGDITIKKEITANGAFVRIESKEGKIDAQQNINAPNNSAVFVADKEIALKTVDVRGNAQAGSDRGGSIQILPNQNNGAGSLFTIGGTGHTNGVNGRLLAQTDTGGGSDPERWAFGVLVVNKGTGGIKLEESNDVVVRATGSKGGAFVLDADGGDIEIPEGTISVNGVGSNSAGVIAFVGKDINFTGTAKTILTATDTVSQNGLQHAVALSAENINYSSAQGLELRANGAGDSTWISAVDILPMGGLVVELTEAGSGFTFNLVFPNGIDGTEAPLNINGPGPFDITANGSNSQVRILGKPVNFNVQGDVRIVSNGAENNSVTVSYTGPSSQGDQGLILTGPGMYEFISNGLDGGDGGSVLFSTPSIDLNPTCGVVCRASGEGSGNGGNVLINATNGSLKKDLNNTVEFISNGGNSGGNAGNVAMTASDQIDLNDVTCRANAVGSGNGGNIQVNGTQIVKLEKATIVCQAGTNGNGGIIGILGDTIQINDDTEEGGDKTLIRSMGGSSSGNGGSINIESQSNTSIGSEVNIFANPQQSGNGGSVTIKSVNTGVDIFGENVNIQAKGLGSNGDGGMVTIEGDDIEMQAQIFALAQDQGKGGTVTINADASLTMEDKLVSVVGGTVSGDGGDINLTLESLFNDSGLNLQARAVENGVGGNINFTVTGTEMTMLPANTAFNLTGGATDGKGGNLTIDHEGELMVETDAVLNANSIASNGGDGGTVTINGQARIMVKGKVVAGGQGAGLGGNITINNPCIDIEDGEIRANGDQGQVNLMGTGSLPFNFTKNSQDEAKGVVAANGSETMPMKGGTVTISNPNAAIMIGSEFAVRANGGSVGDSDGGVVNVTTQDMLTVDGIIAANGVGSGVGGNLTLNALSINSTDGEIRSNGDNGTIDIIGSGSGTFNFMKMSQEADKGLIAAQSVATGPGTAGTITVSNPSGDIMVDSEFAVRANGASMGANGGNITMDTQMKLTVNGKVLANAMGEGSGGNVTLNVNQIDVMDGEIRAQGDNGQVNIMGTGNGAFNFMKASQEATKGAIVSNSSDANPTKAGTVTIDNPNGQITVGAEFAVRANGVAGDAEGGIVSITSEDMIDITGDVTANGMGSGKGGDLTLNGDQLMLSEGTLRARAGTTGNGGTVTLIANKLDDTETTGLEITANADENGEGGMVTITINGTQDTSFGANSKVNVTGGSTDGKAGQIMLDSQGKVKIDTDATFDACGIGSSGGDGGMINATTQDELSILGKIIADSAMEGFAGGQITLNIPSLDFTDGVIQANGDGGSIDFIGNGPGDFVFTKNSTDPDKGIIVANNTSNTASTAANSEAPEQSSISFKPNDKLTLEKDIQVIANGTGTNSSGGLILIIAAEAKIDCQLTADGSSPGDGGTISVQAPIVNIPVIPDPQVPGAFKTNAKFSANSGFLQGKGGVIAIRNGEGSNNLNISAVLREVFSAEGGGTGQGGQVTIEKMDAFLIQTVIKVDGGSNCPVDQPFGKIVLNGVEVQQWRSGFDDWPSL